MVCCVHKSVTFGTIMTEDTKPSPHIIIMYNPVCDKICS